MNIKFDKHIFCNRWLVLGLVVLAGFAVLFLNPNKQSAKVSEVERKSENIQTMPNLTGEKAEKYLKDQGLYKSLGEAMAASRYSIYPTKNAPLPTHNEAFEANNPRQAFSTYFAKDGIHLVSRAKNNKWRVQMNLKGFAQGDQFTEVEETKAEVQKNKSRIELTKTAIDESKIQNPKSKIVEWYENSSNGLEQGWTINEKLTDSDEELKLVLELGGDLKPKLASDKQAIHFVGKNNEQILRYDKLKSWDANGKELASRMELKERELSIVVDDSDASYPITVDPFFTQTKKLTASDAAIGDVFGTSVAISGDTAIVGAPESSNGAAYIFERNMGGANMWGEVQKLTASNFSFGAEFGTSVAISGDTVIIGASEAINGRAYIFERNKNGADMWGEVLILTASDVESFDRFGESVSISGDTAIVGASGNNNGGSDRGSAYIFERNTGGADLWGEVLKLTASDATNVDHFGESVAISGDTAVVGAPDNDDNGFSSGSAYIFERNTGGADLWGEVLKLTASDAAQFSDFGTSVAISGDTAIVGTSLSFGIAYIFERNEDGADMWGEVQKLIGSDFPGNQAFDTSVGISGDTAIIGVPLDDEGGTDSGSAYIFERNTGGADLWGEVQKLSASDAAADDEFGNSVAISGDTAIVGAIFNDDNGSDSGSAYIFTNQFNNWTQTSKPLASDGTAGDQFGFSVGISGDTAIVGARGNTDAGNGTGSAYIFERNTDGVNNWGEVKKITASDAAASDQFGFSVGISGDTAIVGAYLNDDVPSDSGSAYIFERNTGGVNNWGEVKKLTASDADAGDNFGFSVGISGDTAVVGANRNDDAGSDSGSAYIFERNSGGANMWGEVIKLTAPDADAGHSFGGSVGISGDTAIVGARGNGNNGSAYIFERNSGGANMWGEVKKLTASDAATFDGFGESVAISGDTAIVASPFDDDAPFDSGSAYIFERNTGGIDNWGEVQKITASDAAANDHFGISVGISGDTVIVGSHYNDDDGSNSGSAYIFERNTGGLNNWGVVKILTASDAAAGDEFGISVGISGDTAIVGAKGNDIASPLAGKSRKQSNLAGSDQGRVYLFNPLAAPTAANASIAGRVALSNGRGLPRTVVHLTDQRGNIKTARTNQFGYFRFEEIEVGQTLILNAYHKQYQFNSQVINLDGSITDLNITPQ